jgi:pimeloyl-ACP methyl ester carboxylesterase
VQRVVGLLPRAELLLLDGARHAPWFDEPARVAEAVTGFLAER